MDIEVAKEEFATQGYVALRGFTDADEIGRVNDELDRYIRDVFPALPDTAGFFEDKGDPTTLMRLQNMCDYDDYFHDLYYGEKLMDIGRALLDDYRKSVPGRPAESRADLRQRGDYRRTAIPRPDVHRDE